MFRGFKLSINSLAGLYLKLDVSGVSQVDMRPVIDMIKSGKPISARKVANELFPQGEPDIFLSHSFADRDKALAVAKKINEVHNLKVFIDSEVWGSVYELLKEIDDEYCWQNDSCTYSYEKRNRSTAHVYMILNSALHEVIDRSESFIFLGSDNSLVASIKETTEQDDETKTFSPWIHSELLFSAMVRPKRPKRLVKNAFDSAIAAESLSEGKTLIVEHDAPLDHLQEISKAKFEQWLNRPKFQAHGLDKLYNLLAE